MLITNFAAGELSTKLSGRIDLNQYYSGASVLKNFEVIPTGGIKRRTGFQNMGKLSGECRLIPFILDKDNSFLLEITPLKIYIWKNGEKIIGTDGKQISLPCEWQNLAEISDVHYAQDYDRMIFVERHHAPFELKYDFKTETFTGGPMAFDFWADIIIDDDFDYITIAEDSFPPADPKHPYCVLNGRLYKYNETEQKWENNDNDPDVDEKLFAEENKYPGCVAFFQNRLFFASTINDRQKVWASAAPDTEGPRYNEFTTYQKFITVNKSVKDADLHVFTADIELGNIDEENNRTILTNVTQNLLEDGLLKESLPSYFVTQSDYIPVGTKCVSFSWDSTKKKGQLVIDQAIDKSGLEKDVKAIVCTISLWRNINTVSADDYEMQVISNNQTTSDCSFNFELASDQNDAVRFLGAGKYLAIGTESSIWAVPPGITALSISTEMSGRYGSDEIQGHCVDTAMIYFAQGKCGIREYYYNPQAEAFQTNNIAILADHMLTESPAVDFDFMTNPYNRLVITRDDGELVTLLYDKTNAIMAWNRIVHAEGKIRSCAIVRGERQSDILYAAVEHADGLYLEKLDENSAVYLDSWEIYDSEKNYSENFSIYNETKNKVHNLSDGDIPEDFIEDDDTVYAGVRFESLIKSLPVISNDPTGKKRIVNLLVRFLESDLPVMKCGDIEEYFTDVEAPFSGIKQIDYPGISDRDVTFTLSYEGLKDVTILSVDAKTA